MQPNNQNAKLARLLLGNSVGFYVAAKCIADAVKPSASQFPWPPFFENTSYAIELSLKAFILCNGGTENECKSQIRHDLKEALKRARQRNLMLADDRVDRIVKQIGRHHKDRKFCYLGGIDERYLPSVPEVIETTRKLLCAISKQLPLDDLIEA